MSGWVRTFVIESVVTWCVASRDQHLGGCQAIALYLVDCAGRRGRLMIKKQRRGIRRSDRFMRAIFRRPPFSWENPVPNDGLRTINLPMGQSPIDKPSLTEQVRRAAAGDREAWDDLLNAHRARLRRMVALRLDRRLRGRLDPSDVIQEAFLDATAGLGQLRRQAGDAVLSLVALADRSAAHHPAPSASRIPDSRRRSRGLP